jgi:ABC-type dipeptide/oligopeptide/nickel transport system permease subunit
MVFAPRVQHLASSTPPPGTDARNWIPNLYEFWYIVFWPGMAILFFVLGWNLIGDAFRDILDPRLRGRV